LGCALGLLKKIFGKTEELSEKERRLEKRVQLVSEFPLKCFYKGQEVVLEDVSAGGLRFSVGDTLNIGDEVELSFEVPKVAGKTMVKGTVVHISIGYGVRLDVTDDYHEYISLVAPALIGGTMKEYDPSNVNQSDPKYLKRLFFGSLNSTLTLWCQKENKDHVHMFDLRLEDLWIKGEKGSLKFLGVGGDEPNQGIHGHSKVGVATHHYAGNKQDELLNFFGLIIQNIADPWLRLKLTEYLDAKKSELAKRSASGS